jgi:site-specific recombinase XerD
VHLTESGVQPPTLNSSASALRFFFGTTLDRAELARHLARVHYPRKLPRVLSPEEVGRLLEAAPGPGLKYKAALSIAYQSRRGHDAPRQRHRSRSGFTGARSWPGARIRPIP